MTRTVTAAGDHVVIVGAGLAGLCAGLHLLGAGKQVTILERSDHVGGRVGVYDFDDYQIDNGATVLTMPSLITEALAAVGADAESTTPPLRIRPLAPAYHARYSDGSDIDVYSDTNAMFAEIEKTCGIEDARSYLEMRQWLTDLFEVEYPTMMDASFDSPLDLLASPRALLRFVTLGGFGKLGRKVAKFIDDERLVRLFTFQALYAGVAPAKALAAYGAIPYMDTCLGVFYPEGGMRAIAASMADAFTTAGGRLELHADVARIDYAGKRARGAVTADGREFGCDSLILTVDLGSIAPLLEKRRFRKLRASPSAVVLHGTIPVRVSDEWPARSHHTIDFGTAWATTFQELTARRGRGRLMTDPSLLVTRPALTDPGLRIERAGVTYEPLSVLAPCPNLVCAPLDWNAITDAYVRELLAELERRGYSGIASEYIVDHVDTPQTWLDKGMLAGTPFSASHLFRQTGPFRTRNLVPTKENVVLAGCGTTPGVGVPTVLISGKLAAERIVGRQVRGRSKISAREPLN